MLSKVCGGLWSPVCYTYILTNYNFIFQFCADHQISGCHDLGGICGYAGLFHCCGRNVCTEFWGEGTCVEAWNKLQSPTRSGNGIKIFYKIFNSFSFFMLMLELYISILCFGFYSPSVYFVALTSWLGLNRISFSWVLFVIISVLFLDVKKITSWLGFLFFNCSSYFQFDV